MEHASERRDETAAHVGDGKFRMPVWMSAALLAVATLAVYYPAIRNGFVDFDDPLYVTQNQHVRAGLSWRNVEWAFRSIDAANWHPLTWISHGGLAIFWIEPNRASRCERTATCDQCGAVISAA